MNQVWLSGRLAGKPEVGKSQGGITFAKFAIAIQKGSGENRETIFIDCCAFRQTAEFLGQHFNKGDGIEIVGSLTVRDWQDSNGIKRRSFEIIVSQVAFPQLGKSRSNGYGNRQTTPRNGHAQSAAGSQSYNNQY